MTGLTHRQSVVIVASTAIFLGGWLASGANAQTVTIEQYQHPKSEKDFSFNKPYFEGIKDGLVAYNMSLEGRLFCLGGDPPVLTFDRANDILLRWARKRGGDAALMPLSLALLVQPEGSLSLQRRSPVRRRADPERWEPVFRKDHAQTKR